MQSQLGNICNTFDQTAFIKYSTIENTKLMHGKEISMHEFRAKV